MGQGPQKPDHGGNFIMVPRRVVDCVAWRHASFRARAVLMIFERRHKGKDNGHLSLSLTELCDAIGDQNRGANSRAIVELIKLGFIECTSDADRNHARAREYRITFIPTGEGKSARAATHEYEAWRPSGEKGRKFGGARTAPRNVKTGAVTAPRMKLPGAVTAPCSTENRDFEVPPHGAVTALPIGNHLSDTASQSSGLGNINPAPRNPRAADPITVDPMELRAWMKAVIALFGYGGQSRLAKDSGVPAVAIHRFRYGKNLSDDYRLALQTACGRALPYIKWKAAA